MKTFNVIFSTVVPLALIGSVALSMSSPPPVSSNNKAEAEKASQAADSIVFSENAEIDNITRRLELTSQPGLLGFIAVTNAAGAPVAYTCVKGKVTSGGKRLKPSQEVQSFGFGDSKAYISVPTPSDEGTWGSSNPYVYWWTCSGQYFQTTIDYIYSDKPFRLTVQPLIAIDSATKEAETAIEDGTATGVPESELPTVTPAQ